MSDTLLRQWTMLRMIPRYPRKITVGELQERLADQGYNTTERTIQRDLLHLSGQLFALSVDDRSRPHGWHWAQDAEVFDIPGMEPQTALAFKLAEYFLEPLMAPATLHALAPYFRQASQVMEATPGTIRTWPDKVRAVTRGQTLIPPEVDPTVLAVVYDALFNDQQFTARYHRRYDGAVRDYTVNPLGIVFRDGVIYLICTLFDYDDVIQLVLHRMETAEALDSRAHHLEGFDLDVYLREGGLDYRLSDATLPLKLLLSRETAVHLRETPLSSDQAMDEDAQGQFRFSAHVPDTAQLRWWLLGLGANVEVIAPSHLRDEVAETLQAASAQYR